MTQFSADAVAVVNVRTRAIESTIAVGRSPWGVAWVPGGARALVTHRDDRSVSVIDVVARTVIGTIQVGRQPLGIATHPFLPRAYVASYDEDAIDVIDTTTLAVIDRIAVGNGPAGLAVHPAGGELYVANYLASTVSVIDLATSKVVDTIATPALPVGIAIRPDGGKAYVACLKGRAVATIGTVSHTLLGTIRVGRRPVGVGFDAAGTQAYVTNSRDDSVTVIDAANDQALSEVPVGSFPLGIAVADDGGVWVTNGESDECAILRDGAVAATVGTPGKPVSIGRFIGTPPDDCPAQPLPCDDGNPYTGDACMPGVGCEQTDLSGLAAIRAGVSAIQAVIEDAPEDPTAREVGAALPALQAALAAAETGPDRAALRLLRKTLKPILQRLERARRRGDLSAAGVRLLDVAREAKRQVKRLARNGR